MGEREPEKAGVHLTVCSDGLPVIARTRNQNMDTTTVTPPPDIQYLETSLESLRLREVLD